MNEEDVTEQGLDGPHASEDAEGFAPSELREQLAEAEARAQENHDVALRTRAEMENLRRRTERDIENARKYALENFVRELLPVRDSLEMGLAAVSDSDASEQVMKLREGKELTLKMLVSVLEKFGVSEVDPEGELFDPEQHQAMSMLESQDVPPNTVLNVMQKGYLLNDRLVRPAMVVVAKAAATSDGGNAVDEQA